MQRSLIHQNILDNTDTQPKPTEQVDILYEISFLWFTVFPYVDRLDPNSLLAVPIITQ